MTHKVEILLEKFGENVALEKFFFDQADNASLVRVLHEQKPLLTELLREMSPFPINGPLWKRLRGIADARTLQEKEVLASLGATSRELGRLRQSARRLHDWQKAWCSAVRPNSELGDTYA